MLSIVCTRSTLNILLARCHLQLTVINFSPGCSYIIECTNAGALLPLKRVHLLGMSPTTRARYRGTTDPFGDR
jgi:heme oxygenase